MLNRREFLASASIAAGTTLISKTIPAAAQAHSADKRAAKEDLTSYVNVLLGTGGHGHCFPGATVPFGAVLLSPDTGTRDWDWSSGYHHDDTTLMGFSHTHLSGTGVGDMLDLLLVPRTGAVVLAPGVEPEARSNSKGTYRSRFSHEDEKGEPGYYCVLTESSAGAKIKTELTATERTGFARFTFPANEPAYVLIDWHHAYGEESPVKSADIEVVSDTKVRGGRQETRWAQDREI